MKFYEMLFPYFCPLFHFFLIFYISDVSELRLGDGDFLLRPGVLTFLAFFPNFIIYMLQFTLLFLKYIAILPSLFSLLLLKNLNF